MRLRHRNGKIEAQACHWLVRVRDMEYDAGDPIPDPGARMEAFLNWISQSPTHLDAAREAVEASRRLRQIDRHRVIDVDALVSRLRGNLVTRMTRGARVLELARKVTTAAGRPWAICASLLMLLVVPLLLVTVEALPVSYQAHVGQRVQVSLEDSSTIELNTRTRIEVVYGMHSREVTLVSGEAIFDVRHDAVRPFRVISGSTVIEDIGTRFAVYRHTDDTTTVTVLAGRVMVSSTTGKQDLDVGQTVTVGGRSHQSISRAVNLSEREMKRRLSWQTGVLSFEGETLAEAISEVNRYNVRQLVIEDPEIANWQVGGTFQAHDLDAFIVALEQIFDLRAEPMPGEPVIELRRR